MKLKRRCAHFLFTLLLAFFYARLSADVPHQINYQGRLLDDSGNPVNSATDMTFSFYDSETGGNQIGSFSESRTGVPVSNGIFNVLIGSLTAGGIPSSIFSGTTVYVNVLVGGENLTPRPRVVSVGYAYEAEKLSGRDYTAFVDTYTAQTIDGLKTFSEVNISSINAKDNKGLFLLDDGNNGIFIQDGGKIGIGMTAPTQKLDIYNGWISLSVGHGLGWGGLATGIYGSGAAGSGYIRMDLPSASAAFYITNDGKVGIGNTVPGTKLSVAGLTGTASYNYIRLNTATGDFYYDSCSKKWKDNIRPYNTDFGKILQVQPKKFTDKTSGITEIGYIAEDFDDLGLNYLVIYSTNSEPVGLKYERIPLYIIEVVKEQQREIDALKIQIEELKKRDKKPNKD